jgi:glucokinase-like ROK family protein
MKSPQRTEDLRQQNRLAVMRLLFLEGPMSRLEVSRRASLSPGTVTHVASQLLADGLIMEGGQVLSDGGRPRELLEVNPGYGCLVGVDLGETHVQLEAFDLAWRKLGSVRTLLGPQDKAPDRYLDLIAAGLDQLTAAGEIDRRSILGVGVGVPGVVEHNGQVRIAAPMWGWRSTEFLSSLESRIGLPVYIDNGAKAMTLAEAWFGAGRGVQDLAVILIGTGIGAGVITRGMLYRGSTNSAGEWGHTKITLDGRACRCGSHGCLEAYASATGILTSLGEFGGNPIPPGQNQLESLKIILAAYQQGDAAAVQTLQQTAHYLGIGLANLVNSFNPEMIVIGGWAGLLLGESVMDEVTRFLRQYALPPSVESLRIGLCQLGEDAICMGAGCLVLQEILNGNLKFYRRENSRVKEASPA